LVYGVGKNFMCLHSLEHVWSQLHGT